MEVPNEVLLQHWPGVLFRLSSSLHFTFLSSRIEEWTGQGTATWMKDPGIFLQCVHEADVERVRQRLGPAASQEDSLTIRFRFRHATTGRVTHVSEFRRRVRGRKGELECHEGFWQDETPLAHAERRLESAAWTETLARLTPGFAHDFNNVIAGVHGLSDAFLGQLEPGHRFRESLEMMKRKSQEAAQLVQQLQELHLPATGQRSYHDLNVILKDTAEVLRRGISRSIELVIEPAPEQLPVYLDSSELRQTLLALAFNAADAMLDRGRLVLRTTAQVVAPPFAHVAGSPPAGPCVCLSVSDTGPGIPARLLSGLFSTGFTTKPGHCGLGLGLPQARAFAEREGGAISVQTKERAGTTFHLWLPRANFTEAEPAAAVAAARRRHVLLVGLPEGVAGPIAEALRRHGLNAIVAGDDAEARLADPDVVFHATLVCAARDDPDPGRLIQFIRRHRLALKVILQPAGCTEEDLDPQLLTKADLVLAESVTTEQVAERLARELSP